MPRPAAARRPAGLVALATLVALAGGTLLALGPSTPAYASEIYPRPAGGVYDVQGHGWGHGHGLSQWGAQGAASLGRSADEITSTYYPGTARTLLAAAPIRVRVTADDGVDTQVYASPAGSTALSVLDTASGAAAELPPGPARWRVTTDASGLHLSSLTDSTWTPFALAGVTSFAGPVRFRGPTFVRLALPDGTSRDYRGGVQAVRLGSTSLRTVVVLPMESYLLGVVPREASASWLPAALQAQAIAARSYSAYKRAHAAAGSTYDICDSSMCQVFVGSASYPVSGVRTGLEPASTTSAVQATSGVVRSYGGQPIFAEFSSSNGGWSTDGGAPYLVARQDDWDGVVSNSVHSWTGTLSAADLETRYPALGRLGSVEVTARDGNGEWGGRVRTVVLHGTSATGAATSVTTTGGGVYAAHSWPASATGLRSTWWHLTAPATVGSPPTAIDVKYAQVGAAALGAPVSAEQAVTDGRERRYERGRILWSSATGAHVAGGGILVKYDAAGGPAVVGLPTTDETAVTGGRSSAFTRGRIYWSSPTGAHLVGGGILATYLSVGGSATLGVPTTDEVAVPGGRQSTFTRGRIFWSPSTGTKVLS